MPTSKRPATVLLDTNILVRAVVSNDPMRQMAVDAVEALQRTGSIIHVCPQNMQEFRQVATRPADKNGLGWSSADTATMTSEFEAQYVLVPESPGIYPTWRQIVEATAAIGRANFDARLVAIAAVADLEGVLTFEAAAFARYAGEVPGLVILHPRDV